jgi:hypothetical protein
MLIKRFYFPVAAIVMSSVILSCSSDPTNEVSHNHDISKNFISSKNYDLDKWLELDSIFDSSVYNFKLNQSKSKPEYIKKVDSLNLSHDELSQEFYKNYFLNQLEELKSLVSSIDFNNKVSTENLNNFFSKTMEEFYKLNQKMTPAARAEISKDLGKLYAEVIEYSSEVFNNELMSNIEDFANQFKSTLENLFK